MGWGGVELNRHVLQDVNNSLHPGASLSPSARSSSNHSWRRATQRHPGGGGPKGKRVSFLRLVGVQTQGSPLTRGWAERDPQPINVYGRSEAAPDEAAPVRGSHYVLMIWNGGAAKAQNAN